MYKTLYLFKETGFQFIHLQLKPGYVALLFFYTSLFLSDDLNVICVTQICNQKYEFWEDICVNGFFLTTNLIIVFLCEGVMFPCDLINFDVIVYIKPMHIRNNICEVILLQHQRFKDHVWNRSNIHRLKTWWHSLIIPAALNTVHQERFLFCVKTAIKLGIDH